MNSPKPTPAPRAKRSVRARARRRPSRSGWLWFGALLGAGGALVSAFVGWALASGPGTGKRVILEIPENPSSTQVAQLFAERQLITSPWLFSFYLDIVRRGVPIQPGSHIFNDALSPRDLTRRLGRLKQRGSRKVTIVEGFDSWQVAERLEANDVCSAEAFVKVAFDPEALKEVRLEKSAEGFLFPATYDFREDSDPRLVLYQLVKEARRRLIEVLKSEPDGLNRLKNDFGMGVSEILTLASIVEKEAARADERALIAGVFLNRLSDPNFQPRQALQSDPTAAYGCRLLGATIPSCVGFGGKITPAMLRDSLNPYNTYAHPGLPPGPICNPGLGAVRAVLSPAETDYLYFVAVGGGKHAFSRTYAEHQRVYAPKPGAAPVPVATTPQPPGN